MIDTLLDYVARVAPEARVEISSFPSGAVDVLIRHGDRAFAVAFVPAHGFGVSELREEAETAFDGHDEAFSTVEPAMHYLGGLLRAVSPRRAPS